MSKKPGLFTLADKGTIFLDEVSEIPLDMQSKLLGVLQTRKFFSVGGTKENMVDVRIIAATNESLEELVNDGRFRKDLYYRLNVISLVLPPLRERLEDIPALVDYFIEKYCREYKLKFKRIAPTALDLLHQYHFPGNLRELENIIEGAVIMADRSQTLSVEHLPSMLLTAIESSNSASSLPWPEIPERGFQFAEVERHYIEEALKRTNGNQSAAARLLGVERRSLKIKIDNYKIDIEKYQS